MARSQRSKTRVRILSRHDPYNKLSVDSIRATGATEAIMSPVADEFTDNPNVLYDPSRHPAGTVVNYEKQPEQSVSRGDRTAAERSHGNVHRFTIFNQNGGKRLRRI